MKINFKTFETAQTINDDKIIDKILKFQKSKRIDFIETLNEKKYVNDCMELYSTYSNINTFVQLGIGGSSLGPEMLISSLKKSDVEFYFFNNIDTDKMFLDLEKIDIKNSLFYVVSKSGGTAETLAQFAIIANKMLQVGIKESEFNQHFIFATDPGNNDLRKLANELKANCLEIPPNVGGRFSVLTPVGLLPAIFAGIDIRTLTNYAHEYGDRLLSQEDFITTVKTVLNLYNEGVNQTVLMPYSSLLKEFSSWFVQLWAESLGKKRKDGTKTGLTPIASYGATDQHSQMQLFMEGPKDKLLFLIFVKNCKNTLSLKNNFNHPKLQMLSKYTLKNLMDAEFFGTLQALEEQKAHTITLEIEKVDEKSLAELIIFFEVLTAVTGLALEIDPFDQPGVEAGKIYSFQWLANNEGK